MKVRFKRGWRRTYSTLTPGNVYRVLGIEYASWRIVDDAGEPILFSPHAFEVVDPREPDDWIETRDEDGERHAGPAAFSARAFYDDWHERVPEVRARLGGYLHLLCIREAEGSDDSANSYLRVRWKHDHSDEPVVLYCELDEARCEVRKVEEFRDGRMTWAEGRGAIGNTELGRAPVPPLAEITSSEFEPEVITRAEFEAVWDNAGAWAVD